MKNPKFGMKDDGMKANASGRTDMGNTGTDKAKTDPLNKNAAPQKAN